jgi:exopolysaccharide biosynthesis polyprenyl glycosylphosphotransferase
MIKQDQKLQHIPAIRKHHERVTNLWIPLVAVMADMIALEIAFLGSYALRFYGPVVSWIPITKGLPRFSIYVTCSIVALLVWYLVFNRLGFYRWQWTRRIGEVGQKVVTGVSLGMIILLAGIFFYRGVSYSRLVVAIIWVSAIIMVWGERLILHSILRKLFRRGIGARRVAMIGKGTTADILERVLNSRPELGHNLVGWFSPEPSTSERTNLGVWENVREVVRKYEIDAIIVALEDDDRKIISQGLTACEGMNVEFLYAPSVLPLAHPQLRVAELEGIPLLKVKGITLQGWNAVVKRIFDIVLSAISIIILSPVLLITAILIKLSSRGPVFYRQRRVGLDGREFDCLKFRSMRSDAEQTTGPVWAVKADPRVTWVGKIIRRVSIDELPQLWNVLKGEMSVVGPRPERPHFVSQFHQQIPGYLERHRVRSGLTGWAQVNGLRGDTSIELRTQYDIYYVEHWSLGFDIQIIFRTFVEVLFGKNAY